ncbi:UTP--glucose-1-phosphate uridylyltransferase GalU [Campylobacter corcagiensis]|uniref:UTP--glucose-1-phosphate uridylyltransferase n=1 Tax=Campylobacter corcagiensis TaxID=1448857 RepID=A0A7M1LE21_9BACT|nr:UTP--glucose-1-phosphate uridylyltransferase GalU [Campylobacter corcagiensis]QKF65147.1 UTP--glucose-1-phosphate uridylyltransferase [Campylobacter corcagiensis]QOQ86710.1 UTP--glucose-1-phosphate uridylyltransferase GalU [Campylobacter corcagiensis]
MIQTCLFPAAGYGTRFLPATKSLPKEMLPILTKPLIHYGVDEAREAGMNHMAFVTGRGKRALEDYFDTSYELEHQISGTDKENLLKDIRELMDNCRFSFTRQRSMNGLGDAINKGKVLVGDDPFGVVLADDLCINENGDGVMAQMLRVFEKYRCSIVAVMEVDKKDVSKYGIVEGREIDDGLMMVSDMVEKPKPEEAKSNLAIIGRYILTPNIFTCLDKTKAGKNGEIQITDALLKQAKEGIVIAYKFKGKRFDCGSLDGFVQATKYFYDRLKNGKK